MVLAGDLYNSGTELLHRSQHGGFHRCYRCALCGLCGGLRDRHWNDVTANTSIATNTTILRNRLDAF
jgi:hypothetical protein